MADIKRLGASADKVRLVVLVLVAGLVGSLFGPSLSGAIVAGSNPTPDEPLAFVPIVPCAVFDTRSSTDYLSSIPTGDTVTFVAAGTIPVSQINEGAGPSCTAPPAGVEAVEVNLIGVGPEGRGNLRIAESGQALNASVVNFSEAADAANSNSVPVKVGPTGELDVRVGGAAGVTVKIQAVIMGYYVSGTSVYESFDRTVVVGGSGNPEENGIALQNAVAAVNAQLPSLNDPWLIKLEPGFYETDSPIELLTGVSLQGSGRHASTIQTLLPIEGLVVVEHGELSDVSVVGLDSSATASKSVLVPLGGFAVLTNVYIEANRGDALHVDAGADVNAQGISAVTASSSQAALDSEGTVVAHSSSFQAISGGIGIQLDSTGWVTIHHSQVGSVGGDGLDSALGSIFVARQSAIVGSTNGSGFVDCLDTVTATAWLEDTCS